MQFNLLSDGFIPVLTNDGRFDRIGVCEALAKAGQIRQIAASNPMDGVALLRFLLAILYWCKGTPPTQDEKHRLGQSGRLPVEWFARLDQQRECFGLLGTGARFYQYRDTGRLNDGKLTANYLLHEVPTGRNAWHFRHSTDRKDGLCPACVASGLIRLPLFATSGGRGKPPGINAKPPIYVVPVGRSLLETLLLNWLPVTHVGAPAWEHPDMRPPSAGAVPLLAGLTWLPRRVWLDDPEVPGGPCIACGRNEPALIRTCVFAGVSSSRLDDDGPGRNWLDPHVVYTSDKSGALISVHASDALDSSDAAANQWAMLLAGVLAQEPTGPRALRHAVKNMQDSPAELHVSTVGFSSVQNDKYLEAWEVRLALPANVLLGEDGPAFVVHELEQWRKEGSRLVRKIRAPNEKAGSRQYKEVLSCVAAIRPHVEGRVSARLGMLFDRGAATWERAAAEYRPMMITLANSLSPGFTTATIQRRRQIAGTMPNMRRDSDTTNRPRKRNGGDA